MTAKVLAIFLLFAAVAIATSSPVDDLSESILLEKVDIAAKDVASDSSKADADVQANAQLMDKITSTFNSAFASFAEKLGTTEPTNFFQIPDSDHILSSSQQDELNRAVEEMESEKALNDHVDQMSEKDTDMFIELFSKSSIPVKSFLDIDADNSNLLPQDVRSNPLFDGLVQNVKKPVNSGLTALKIETLRQQAGMPFEQRKAVQNAEEAERKASTAKAEAEKATKKAGNNHAHAEQSLQQLKRKIVKMEQEARLTPDPEEKKELLKKIFHLRRCKIGKPGFQMTYDRDRKAKEDVIHLAADENGNLNVDPKFNLHEQNQILIVNDISSPQSGEALKCEINMDDAYDPPMPSFMKNNSQWVSAEFGTTYDVAPKLVLLETASTTQVDNDEIEEFPFLPTASSLSNEMSLIEIKSALDSEVQSTSTSASLASFAQVMQQASSIDLNKKRSSGAKFRRKQNQRIKALRATLKKKLAAREKRRQARRAKRLQHVRKFQKIMLRLEEAKDTWKHEDGPARKTAAKGYKLYLATARALRRKHAKRHFVRVQRRKARKLRRQERKAVRLYKKKNLKAEVKKLTAQLVELRKNKAQNKGAIRALAKKLRRVLPKLRTLRSTCDLKGKAAVADLKHRIRRAERHKRHLVERKDKQKAVLWTAVSVRGSKGTKGRKGTARVRRLSRSIRKLKKAKASPSSKSFLESATDITGFTGLHGRKGKRSSVRAFIAKAASKIKKFTGKVRVLREKLVQRKIKLNKCLAVKKCDVQEARVRRLSRSIRKLKKAKANAAFIDLGAVPAATKQGDGNAKATQSKKPKLTAAQIDAKIQAKRQALVTLQAKFQQCMDKANKKPSKEELSKLQNESNAVKEAAEPPAPTLAPLPPSKVQARKEREMMAKLKADQIAAEEKKRIEEKIAAMAAVENMVAKLKEQRDKQKEAAALKAVADKKASATVTAIKQTIAAKKAEAVKSELKAAGIPVQQVLAKVAALVTPKPTSAPVAATAAPVSPAVSAKQVEVTKAADKVVELNKQLVAAKTDAEKTTISAAIKTQTAAVTSLKAELAAVVASNPAAVPAAEKKVESKTESSVEVLAKDDFWSRVLHGKPKPEPKVRAGDDPKYEWYDARNNHPWMNQAPQWLRKESDWIIPEIPRPPKPEPKLPPLVDTPENPFVRSAIDAHEDGSLQPAQIDLYRPQMLDREFDTDGKQLKRAAKAKAAAKIKAEEDALFARNKSFLEVSSQSDDDADDDVADDVDAKEDSSDDAKDDSSDDAKDDSSDDAKDDSDADDDLDQSSLSFSEKDSSSAAPSKKKANRRASEGTAVQNFLTHLHMTNRIVLAAALKRASTAVTGLGKTMIKVGREIGSDVSDYVGEDMINKFYTVITKVVPGIPLPKRSTFVKGALKLASMEGKKIGQALGEAFSQKITKVVMKRLIRIGSKLLGKLAQALDKKMKSFDPTMKDPKKFVQEYKRVLSALLRVVVRKMWYNLQQSIKVSGIQAVQMLTTLLVKRISTELGRGLGDTAQLITRPFIAKKAKSKKDAEKILNQIKTVGKNLGEKIGTAEAKYKGKVMSRLLSAKFSVDVVLSGSRVARSWTQKVLARAQNLLKQTKSKKADKKAASKYAVKSTLLDSVTHALKAAKNQEASSAAQLKQLKSLEAKTKKAENLAVSQVKQLELLAEKISAQASKKL